MGQIKWYKRDPDKALNGMMELTLEERGAYNTVLDLIYTRDGNLPDDDYFIAGWCRVDPRVWKRIKKTLIDRGKLYVESGMLRNSKADEEVLTALSRVGSAKEAGHASARSRAIKSQAKSNEINDEGSAGVETGDEASASTNNNHNQNSVEAYASTSNAREPNSAKRPRGHRLPADWQPRPLPPDLSATVSLWPPGALERELARFRDWAASASGQVALKQDWDAAWRNWLRKADEEGRFRRHGNGQQADRGGSTRSAAQLALGRIHHGG